MVFAIKASFNFSTKAKLTVDFHIKIFELILQGLPFKSTCTMPYEIQLYII